MSEFDAIVIGSGATGGVAAKQLSEAGLNVLVLEAGPGFAGGDAYGTPNTNLVRQLYAHFIRRRQPVQERHSSYWDVHPGLFVDDIDHPYTTPTDKPYRWIRNRVVGGRSLTWGGVTLRLSNHEFKAASRDGIGDDWPIEHDDLAPYYDELEQFFAVHGSRERLPQLPDGVFLPARPLTSAELHLRQAFERVPGCRLIPSRGIRAGRYPDAGEQFSRLSSIGTTLAAALATGRTTVQSGAVVARLIPDPNTGRIRAVEYIETATGQLRRSTARIVFLCASTIESVRLLMASASPTHEGGIGAASGMLGRGLMDHIVSCLWFYLPDVADDGRAAHELLGSDGIIVPRFQNLGPERAPYLRGFGLWGGAQRMFFPEFLRKKRGCAIGFLCAMAEALPDEKNHMRLDPEVRDKYGLAVPHLSCAWTDNDLVLSRAARAAAQELIAAAGGVVCEMHDLVHLPVIGGFMKQLQSELQPSIPGLFVHEVGGARMGREPRGSVVNRFCQCWDAPNLFVTDGACWVSSGWQNPTLTEMAITARAADHAVAELRRMNL